LHGVLLLLLCLLLLFPAAALLWLLLLLPLSRCFCCSLAPTCMAGSGAAALPVTAIALVAAFTHHLVQDHLAW